MLTITALNAYPVKSLGGTALSEATIDERGIVYDRQWMVVDENNTFLTQRDLPKMALLQAKVTSGLLVIEKQGGTASSWSGNVDATTGGPLNLSIFDESCAGLRVSDAADEWLSGQLGVRCHLVVMPDSSRRPVDPDYAHHGEITAFTNGYPFLLVGESSLDALNERLSEPVPMNCFRPNIVITGSDAYAEDRLTGFTIGAIKFSGVKNCGRCQITTVDQERGEMGKEPLQTLAGYRREGRKVLFGRYLIHSGTGKIRLGDALENAEF